MIIVSITCKRILINTNKQMIKLLMIVSYNSVSYLYILVMKLIEDMNGRLSNAENSITLLKAMGAAANGSSDGSGL